MARARIALIALAALTLVGGPLGPARVAPASPLRAVEGGGVVALVPRTWEARALTSTVPTLSGVRASTNLDGWSTTRGQGIEAYWVDATRVGIPSDYFRSLASGPALVPITSAAGCRAEERTVWTHREHGVAGAAGAYLATATGTCADGKTRWGAFVAAPGFGVTRSMGIARSGLYYAFVAVREGPVAERRVSRLLSRISFGGTEVREFLQAVGAPSVLI